MDINKILAQPCHHASSRLGAQMGRSSQTQGSPEKLHLACGKSSVEKIAEAIGLSFEYVSTRKKHDSFYIVHDRWEEA